MPREFWRATAEAVVTTVDAVGAIGDSASAAEVAAFAQLTADQATAALSLAVDLGLLQKKAAKYEAASPLCSAFSTSDQKRRAAALRLVLEVYEPFVKFRERLLATESATTAAGQVKILMDLSAHQEEIKDTLLSLGQYAQAISALGGGAYSLADEPSENPLEQLAEGCSDDVAAERRIRLQLGSAASALVSRDDVIVPLASALQRCVGGDPQGAVVLCGNSVESYLMAYGARVGENLAAYNGISQKADQLRAANKIPAKLVAVCKYLGAVRNAADHGIDADVGAPWQIRPQTALEYVFVACSFIAALTQREQGGPVEI